MPSTGLLPFLLGKRKVVHLHVVQVSMPSTGLLPFLRRDSRRVVNKSNVSMPSTGLLPFLQKYFHMPLFKDNGVSMPSTGLLPFLLL